MLHGFPGRLHHQAVLRVDRRRLAVADAEELGVEPGDVVDETTPPGHRTARHTGLGVVVLVEAPPVRGDVGDQIIAAQQRVPELFGGVDPAGQPAGHANHRDRCDLGFSHEKSFTFPMPPWHTPRGKQRLQPPVRRAKTRFAQICPAYRLGWSRPRVCPAYLV